MASTILSDNGVSSGSAGIKTTADSTGALALQTTTAGGAATTALTIDTSQNVGIGTASPATKLHVEQSTTGDAFKVAKGGNYLIMGGSGSGTQYVKGYEGVVAFGNAFAGASTFLTNDTERMRIDSSGNVGIGTTSPSVKLDIVGSVAISGEISGAVVATQANQEAGTSTTTIVTPGRQQYHPSAAKFWIMADNAGATQASYNVTSITDVGTGEITVTIANDFSSASYCSLGTALQNTVGVRNIKVKTQSAGSITYTCVGETPAYVDPTNYMLCAFGDQ